METRKETLNTLKLCRFCLTQDETLTSLYDRRRAPKNSVPLTLKILSCVSIEVFPSDRMPAFICNRCKFFMDISYEFKQLCRQADENVLEFIQSGTDLNSVSWPASLKKLYWSATKSAPERAVMKTVVEGGATIQVTAHESDSDEDDENVYNVKIADESDEGSKSARVKVVTTDKQSKRKVKSSKGFSSVSKLTRHVRTHAGDRSYPCKHCDKSFMKSHHYTRHLRLKHREINRSCRGPFGESDYRCEQCEDTFATQDELIYHSAIHATQNLICPLCQEKFDDVDAVTAHIKSHVNGMEFMCDLCELVFTSKEKLDNHMLNAHDDELQNDEELAQDESSMEMDADDDEDDTGINVKEEDGHMVVEIKKTDGFLLPNLQDDVEEKNDNTNSEESEPEIYAELPTEDPIVTLKKEPAKPLANKSATENSSDTAVTKHIPATIKTANKNDNEDNRILRKAEEIKRKVQPTSEPIIEKKNKTESTVATNNTGANDKSLRLLEKELQELKRTNTRSEVVRTPTKPMETLRNRRPQLHTSTPKIRSAAVEEKKIPVSTKSPSLEKKQPEKRTVTKENKEPKEVKDAKGNNGNIKEEKEKEVKEAAKTKVVQVKKVSNEKTTPEEGIRRSTRPSKIKDYAKMIRDRTQESEEEDDSDEVDEEYKETEKNIESKTKLRRASVKPSPKPSPVAAVSSTPTPTPRKRGRPRKDATATPAKIKKEDSEGEAKPEENNKQNVSNKKPEETETVSEPAEEKSTPNNNLNSEIKTAPEAEPNPGVLVSPTGHTLKKIPVKSLPPGITPIPLPRNARPMGTGELCKMQIGKKMVNVQKIVVTKAEVEAMAKRGLVQMKDGTMVLKQGIKIPTSDPAAIKTLVGDDTVQQESPKKKAVPTRCDIEEDV